MKDVVEYWRQIDRSDRITLNLSRSEACTIMRLLEDAKLSAYRQLDEILGHVSGRLLDYRKSGYVTARLLENKVIDQYVLQVKEL